MLALAAQVPPQILHLLIRFDDTNIIRIRMVMVHVNPDIAELLKWWQGLILSFFPNIHHQRTVSY